MPATPEQWDQLNNFICVICGHRAVLHVVHRGPCSGCWAEGLTICEAFAVRDEDRPAVDALLASMVVMWPGLGSLP